MYLSVRSLLSLALSGGFSSFFCFFFSSSPSFSFLSRGLSGSLFSFFMSTVRAGRSPLRLREKRRLHSLLSFLLPSSLSLLFSPCSPDAMEGLSHSLELAFPCRGRLERVYGACLSTRRHSLSCRQRPSCQDGRHRRLQGTSLFVA